MHSLRRGALVALASAFILAVTPAIAQAELLTNVYGQQFAGQAVCVECHGSNYSATTHGDFARAGALQPGEAAADMYPAGRIGVGEAIGAADVAFTLGAGSGLREYLGFRVGGGDPFDMLEGMEWAPEMPETWEIPTSGIERGDYTCSQCHQLGVVRANQKPLAGTFAAIAATAGVNAWATFPSTPSDYEDGASIQCERCHGTGVDSLSGLISGTGHWNSGVKIVGYNTATMKPSSRTASQRILKSEVCGQCHASFKSGNIIGYTPDQVLNNFVTQYQLTDVPTEASWTANPEAYKFYPSGHNSGLVKASGSAAGMKHVYYTEWGLSAHAYRAALTSSSAEAMPFQKAGRGGFNVKTSPLTCVRCHTGEGYLKRKDAYIMAEWQESTATAGQIGQECAVCHVSHDVEGGGLMIRAADKAGEGSCAGLSTDNASMCEDCHNWQFEVQGLTLNTQSPGSRGPSHPQRELVHGRSVMQDVDDAGAFMPGATCEECHMPATKSDFPATTGLERYADRSFKRYSHRMLIMEPGDADSWGLAPWGDSCSPCHPGETQAELQANLDTWQADASALSASALSAINDAKLRAEYTGGSTSGKELYGRAFINYRAYLNDGSGGAHNPPYIQAGLKAAKRMADSVGGGFADVYSTSRVIYGGLGAIAANVENGDGSPAAGADIALEKLVGGVWTQQDLVCTDDNGGVIFLMTPTSIGDYRLRWDRCDNNNADIYSAVKRMTVVSITTAARSRSTLNLGGSFVLSGSVTPGDAGARVRIQAKKGTGSYKTIYYNTLSASSTYARTIKPSSRGTWYYRVTYFGNSAVAGSTSPAVKVVCK